MQTSRFNLVSLVVIVLLLGLLTAALFPAMNVTYKRSGMDLIAVRGKDIYVAITAANTEREPLGLPPVWPQSNPPSTNATDISQMNFPNSTDYFWALNDGDHAGTAQHNPYVRGFDFRKLSKNNVPAILDRTRLKPQNNLWTIAKNVREDMDDVIPVLVTRNVAAESLVTDIIGSTLFSRRLYFDEEWKTPFGDKGFLIIRKGGGVLSFNSKYDRVGFVYNCQTFRTTIAGSQLPGLRYLTPSKEVIPSEAAYQACAAAYENRNK